ncbi:MAG TPA: hypothetical protein VH989_09450 [Actinomycetota bacterium]|jgi:hypothetical protein
MAGAVAIVIAIAALAFAWNAFRPSAAPSPGPAASTTSIEPTPPPPFANQYFPLSFPEYADDGWHLHDGGFVQDDEATIAWASTVGFDDRDLDPLSPAIPIHTIGGLAPGEIVITTEATPWSYDPSQGPYPPGSLDRLDLADADVRGPEAEEPAGDYTVYEIPDAYVLVRVYFGSAAPTEQQVQRAQDQLDLLAVPPVCPVPSESGFEATATPAEGAPGDTVTITGPMPFQKESGYYDQSGATVIIAWWNADPKDWAYLSSFSTIQPSPSAPGPLLRLGEGGVGLCSFSISFKVPDVPAGDYSVVLLQEGPLPHPDGSTMEDSLVMHVTAPTA